MKLIIYGAAGRMGTILCDKINAADDMELAAAISRRYDGQNGCYPSLEAYGGTADCLIDFSNHASTKAVLDYCVAKKIPAVIASTGHSPEEKDYIAEAAKNIPVFYSANMSVGIAVLADAAKQVAAAMKDAEIEIVETHHDQKLDVPSGTALLLADAIREARPEATYNIGRHENGKRTKEEIGIHAIRLGNEKGTHEILISTGMETITLKHQAFDRALFADGALKAAKFLADKPAGFYNMKSMLGK